jgi:L-lactate dehydrogenase complex protein LldG
MPTVQGVLPNDAPDRRKRLAAPSLGDNDFGFLVEKGRLNGFDIIKDRLRDYLAGIEVTFTVADLGIAETATCVFENQTEDDRLAAMICETHVVGLAIDKLVKDSYQAEEFLKKALARDSNQVSFISGPSRTSDIERVLTLGVHGPLRLHVALMEK